MGTDWRQFSHSNARLAGQGAEEPSETSAVIFQNSVALLWAKPCFDFVAIVSQWQSASDEDWALELAREAVIRFLG
jgi:hypothetical protein